MGGKWLPGLLCQFKRVSFKVQRIGLSERLWMMTHRKNIVGLGEENTNNRIERLWRTLKDFPKQMASGKMSIFKAVQYFQGLSKRGLMTSMCETKDTTFACIRTLG